MIDAFDIIAFVAFAVTLVVLVVIVVTLGSLPTQIAQKRGHPHAAAITIASWVGLAAMGLGAVAGGAEGSALTTMGVLWPVALIWAFFKPAAAGPPSGDVQTGEGARLEGKEAAS